MSSTPPLSGPSVADAKLRRLDSRSNDRSDALDAQIDLSSPQNRAPPSTPPGNRRTEPTTLVTKSQTDSAADAPSPVMQGQLQKRAESPPAGLTSRTAGCDVDHQTDPAVDAQALPPLSTRTDTEASSSAPGNDMASYISWRNRSLNLDHQSQSGTNQPRRKQTRHGYDEKMTHNTEESSDSDRGTRGRPYIEDPKEDLTGPGHLPPSKRYTEKFRRRDMVLLGRPYIEEPLSSQAGLSLGSTNPQDYSIRRKARLKKVSFEIRGLSPPRIDPLPGLQSDRYFFHPLPGLQSEYSFHHLPFDITFSDQEQQRSTDLLASFFFTHPDLNQHFRRAGKSCQVTTLQRYFRRRLTDYGLRLLKEATNDEEKSASVFVCDLARPVAEKVFLTSTSQHPSQPDQPHSRNAGGATYDTDGQFDQFPNLDSVQLFLESSNAFQILKRDIQSWIDSAVPSIEQTEEVGHKDLDDETSVPESSITNISPWHTLPEFLDSIMGLFQPLLPEPAIPLGRRRLRWKCSCGQQFYDDFVELDGGALESLRLYLQRIGRTNNNVGYFPSSLQSIIPTVQGLLVNLGQRARHSATRINETWTSRRNTTLPSHSKPNSVLPSNTQDAVPPLPALPKGRLLLMSIDEGAKYTGLHERQLCNITNDQQLFSFLRAQYHGRKPMPPFLTMRSVALSFSEFLVDVAHFAEVRPHRTCPDTRCTCLPPIERVIDDDEYQCSPAPERPLGYAPPYSPKLLTHYFQNPQCVPDTKRDIFLQLPKRVGPLPLSGESRVPGWGVHFEEDWHQPTLFLLIWVFFVVGGLAFGIAWSVSKGDVSSAFAVTASWLAIAPILFAFAMARSSARGR